MFASDTPDMMHEQDSLPHEAANAAARVALKFADFLTAVADDNAQAATEGWTLVDATGNGYEGNGHKVRTYVSDVTRPQIARALARVMTLARLAGRVSALASRDEDMPAIDAAMRASLARMSNLDRTLWDVFASEGKQHMSGVEQGIMDIDGFAWTSSRKGHTTEIRYSETAEKGMRAYKALHANAAPSAYVSERDLAN